MTKKLKYLTKLILIISCVLLLQANYAQADAEFVYIPDVVNKKYSDAIPELSNALKPLNCSSIPAEFEYVSDPALHDVILKTIPAGGSKVMRCGSVTTVIGKNEKLFPNVIGMDKAKAIETINNFGYSYIVIEEHENKEKPPGVIFAQNPYQSTPMSALKPLLKPGFEIKLYVTPGISTIKIPDVVGKTETDAVDTVKNAGFTNVKVIYQNIKTRSENTVDSVSPPAGSVIRSATTPVQITVAKNNKKYMPDLAGMTEQQVRDKLKELGVPEKKIWISQYPFNKNMADGIVHHQSPNPGDEIDSIISSAGMLVAIGINKLDAIPIPIVTQLTYEEAKKKLNDAGFTSIHDYYTLYTDKELAEKPYMKDYIGKVVTTDPGYGVSVTPNTYIAVYIGKSETPIAGLSEVEVPNVGGVKEESAVARLKMNGLVPKIIYETTVSDFQNGITSVITDPKQGTKVKAGTEVKITVYRFKPKVPALKSLTKDEAIKMLTNLGLKYQITEVSNNIHTNNGLVKDYEPGFNTQVEPGSTVKLTVYKYDRETVPNLKNMTEAEAVKFLKEFKPGLKYKIQYEDTVYKTEAEKVTKISPGAGTTINLDSSITIYVKKLLASVPNVVGKTEADALNTLKNYGFEVRTAYLDSKDNAGKVLEQSQKAGEAVKGVVITITVGKKPDNVKLPNVVGKSQSEAINIIKSTASLSYKVQEKHVYTSSQEGTVVHMYPAGNSLSAPDTQVALYVGKYVGNVPDVVGLSENEAKNKLSKAGFAGIVLYTNQGTPGKVVNQKPDAGGTPNPPPKGNFVNIFVAKTANAQKQEYNPWGQEYVMPYVTGLSIMEARSMLAENKINYIVREQRTMNDRHGKILRTNPGAGGRVNPNQTAILFVGKSQGFVPNLIGMTGGMAESYIKAEQMQQRIKFKQPSPDVKPSGPPVVIEQNPGPGLPKQSLYVYYTLGYDFVLPNFTGKSMAMVIPEMQNLGLKYNIEYQQVEEGNKDRVVLRMDPSPGQTVLAGSTINFTVGKLPDAVPDLIGKNEKEAVNILGRLNFYPEKEYLTSNRSNNIVIAQDQQPGSRRSASNIKIMLGPQESLASIDKPTPVLQPAPAVKAAPKTETGQEQIAEGPPPPRASMNIKMQAPAADESAKINELYKKLKQAYEYKDEYQVTALLSKDWQSADGTSVRDVEDNLRNKFTVYDTIQCGISGLNINKTGTNKFTANYDIEITGKTYDTGISRKEKSSVSEEVVIENNKAFINRTLSGRFWYRQ